MVAVEDIMKRYRNRMTALLCVLALPLNAQHAGAGTTIFSFMNVHYDARSVALAGASVALANDCYGIFSNPAALAGVSRMQAVIGYRPLGAGIYGAPLAYALPRKGIGVLGAGFYGLTSGKVEVTDIAPDATVLFTGESARVDNIAGYALWARKVNDYLSAGVTVKGIYTGIKGFEEGAAVRWSADGFALDGGVQCRFQNSRLIYGVVVRNVGFVRSGFEEDEDGFSLPFGVEIGVSYMLRNMENLRLIAELGKQRNDFLAFTPAAEWEVLPQQLTVRAGYRLDRYTFQKFKNTLVGEANTTQVRSTMTGLCLGVGFSTDVMERNVKFDAAAEFLTIPVLPAIVASILMQI